MWRLLDTNIVSYFVNQHTLATTNAPHTVGFDLAIAVQTLGELLEGGKGANWGPARWQRHNDVVQPLLILDATPVVAEWWAEVRVARRSRPISVDDAWIAATALAYGIELVTHNPADFAGIPGLTVISEAP